MILSRQREMMAVDRSSRTGLPKNVHILYMNKIRITVLQEGRRLVP